MKNPSILNTSLMTTFRRSLWSPFRQAIKKYQLIEENDKIAICISGGKDSFIMALLFQELLTHQAYHFDVVYLVMDPGYSKINRQLIETNGKKCQLDLHIFNSPIFENIAHMDKNYCYQCARSRRGFLYHKAKELGCNKIALGHHFDDALETHVMNMVFKGKIEAMMPKLKSKNVSGIELIRPLILTKEDSIIDYMHQNDLHFLQCACRYTEKKISGDRDKAREIITYLQHIEPNIEINLFNTLANINLKKVYAYKNDTTKRTFHDDYDKYE